METPSPAPDAPGIQRVSTLELFFDLVFVFAITQLTDLVAHPHGPADYARAVLVAVPMMWIYLGFTWLTSNLAIARGLQRGLIFVAMAGFFVMALSLPTVFGAGGLPYGLGLLAVTAVHAGLFALAPTTSARAIRGIAPFNFASALLVLGAAFVQPPWDWPLWAAASGVLVAAAARRRESGFVLSPAHFVERNGLLLIVALGESVVAVGIGAEGLPLTPALLASAVLALFLSWMIWWSYFDRDDQRAEHAMTAADPIARARMALLAFGLAQFVMIFGIVVFAAGLKVAIAQPLGHPEGVGVWNVAAGLALYLLGDRAYRRVLGLGPGRVRGLVALLAFATVPVGLAFGALAQLAACAVVVQPLWMADEASRKREAQAERSATGNA